MRSEVLDHGLVLDLTEVKLVDREAVQILAQSEVEGARLRSCSEFLRKWILQERSATRRAEAEHLQAKQE